MRNSKLKIVALLGVVMCSCGSKESQLHTSLNEVMKMERGLHYFYEMGGVDSISGVMASSKGSQIARIEDFAAENKMKLSVVVDSARVLNSAKYALVDRLYRAKAAEEYLLGVSYVELEDDLKDVEGADVFLEECMSESQQNIERLTKVIESVE